MQLVSPRIKACVEHGICQVKVDKQPRQATGATLSNAAQNSSLSKLFGHEAYHVCLRPGKNPSSMHWQGPSTNGARFNSRASEQRTASSRHMDTHCTVAIQLASACLISMCNKLPRRLAAVRLS